MAKKADKHRDVIDALRKTDFTSLEGWEELEELSSHTELDDIEIFEEEITIKDDKFSGPINVYVLLNYGDDDDESSISSGFPGSVIGHFEGGKPKIDRIDVNTSSFYE